MRAQGGVRGFIRSWVELADVGVLLFNIGGNRWCGNVGRAHKSNGAGAAFQVDPSADGAIGRPDRRADRKYGNMRIA